MPTAEVAKSSNTPVDKASVEIKELAQGDEHRWDQFVAAHPDGTFFHRAGWREVLARAFGHRTFYLLAEEQGEIRGVLPLGLIDSWLFGKILISTPFCVYGGALAITAEIRKALERSACELAESLEVDCLELRNREPSRPEWPSRSDLYVAFRKAIDPDPEANLSAIPRKQRAMIRKGIKAGLSSRLDQDVDQFFRVYSESVRNLGTPVFPLKYFRILKEVFGGDCQVLTVTHEDRVVASVMSFYSCDEVLPYYGGGTALARQLRANDFMYWELMRRACESGVRVFDYGRSKVGAGSYSFKKNWGFEPTALHYEYHLVRASELPNVNPNNPKYRLLIDVWKRLPLPISQRLGPIIARNLG